MATSGFQCQQSRSPIKTSQLRPNVLLLNDQNDARVLAPFHLPVAVKRHEMLLILGDQYSAQPCGGGEVEFIILTTHVQLGGQVNQMARRAKLAGQSMIDYAVVKV